MDPLTQGVVGAIAAQQITSKKKMFCAAIVGFFSGMAADLDILIRSSNDPFLALEFHRNFTHSIVFIPIGGLVCAITFYYLFLKRYGFGFKNTYFFSTAGYATHGLIDSCTSYGTQLFWPFSNYRVSWDIISIIDPLFTLPLLFLIFFSIFKKKKLYIYIATCWIFLYFLVGYIQHDRAIYIGKHLALSRGHNLIKINAKPSFANLLVWKVIYTTKTNFVVDAVKVGFNTKVYKGSEIEILNIKKEFPELNVNSQQAKDIERFKWFSDGYVARSKKFPNRIDDIRYSMLPNEISGLWGIEIDPYLNNKNHAKYVFNRAIKGNAWKKLWKMIIN